MTPSKKVDTSKAAVKAVEEAEAVAQNNGQSNVVVALVNGIRLRTKPVPPFLLDQVTKQVPEPMPPVVEIDQGEGNPPREEENPDDPRYLEELKKWTRNANTAAIDAMLLAGTEVDHVPKGMYRPEEEGWLEFLEVLGVSTEYENKHRRYLAWLRLYALSDTRDIAKVTRIIGSGLMISEEDVASAAEGFQGAAVGGVDSEDSSEKGSGNGDTLPKPSPRNGGGNRRARRSKK